MEILELKKSVKTLVSERLDFRRDFTDEEVHDLIDEVMLEQKEMTILSIPQRRQLHTEVFDSLRRLDVLQAFVDDKSVTEIMVNGPNSIFIERNGSLIRVGEQFESEGKMRDVIQLLVLSANRTVNEANPIVDSRLTDGSRVNVVLNPIAIDGPIITIRKFPEKPITMDDLISYGSISIEAAEFLEKCVRAKYNIFVSGGTGSGKTTFLNVLSDYIPQDERVITIEDSAELQLHSVENLVRLETRNANSEGCSEITIRDLIKSSLRMRPDRIIVGEVRGAEAFDMLQCLNTGHDGSMSTGHANSAHDMLSRLENMVLMGSLLPLEVIRGQIANGLDIIVHLSRLRDKSRRVMEISEVLGYENGEILTRTLYGFEYSHEDVGGRIVGELKKKAEMSNIFKLDLAGL